MNLFFRLLKTLVPPSGFGLYVITASSLLMWSVITIYPIMLCILSVPVRLDISIFGSLIEISPPSLNDIIYFPILDPPIVETPAIQALYSKNPENLYELFGPSSMKLVIGG